MLNRTNLTQTALLNGLYLGTRSLVLGTSLNSNGKALTVRDSHHGFMRDGMKWHVVKSVLKRIYDVPEIPIPCSEPQASQFQSPRSASKRPGSLGFIAYKPCFPVDSTASRLRGFAAVAAKRANSAAAAAAGA